MGVDYYNCDVCGEIYADCGHCGSCDCGADMCGGCLDDATEKHGERDDDAYVSASCKLCSGEVITDLHLIGHLLDMVSMTRAEVEAKIRETE